MNPPDHRLPDLLPGSLREVRLRGLLWCCQDMLTRCDRVTRVGSEAECPACHAVVRVDDVGAWTWHPVATAESLRRLSAYS